MCNAQKRTHLLEAANAVKSGMKTSYSKDEDPKWEMFLYPMSLLRL